MNERKIILDLCGGTGAWSAPYRENGYDVRVITLPEYDLLERTILDRDTSGGGITFLRKDGTAETVTEMAAGDPKTGRPSNVSASAIN